MSDSRSTQEIWSSPGDDPTKWIVLVVDDEYDNATIAQKVLSFRGATVHIAHNGAEGLEMLEQLRPTFILLDISMPVMNGWIMLENVRSNPQTANIPVIALTAHAMTGDAEKTLAAGFNAYIAKPFRISTLLVEIVRCLQEIRTS